MEHLFPFTPAIHLGLLQATGRFEEAAPLCMAMRFGEASATGRCISTAHRVMWCMLLGGCVLQEHTLDVEKVSELQVQQSYFMG